MFNKITVAGFLVFLLISAPLAYVDLSQMKVEQKTGFPLKSELDLLNYKIDNFYPYYFDYTPIGRNLLTRSCPNLSCLNSDMVEFSKLKVNDTIKNSISFIGGNALLYENVNQVTFNGTENWSYGWETTNTILYFVKPINKLPGYNELTSNLFTYNTKVISNGYELRGISSYTDNNIYVRVFKTDLIDFNDSLSLFQKVTLFKTYLSQNNLIVTYQLAVSNPKEKVISDSDVNQVNTFAMVNIDLVFINKPSDFIGYNNQEIYTTLLENYTYVNSKYLSDNVSEIGKFSLQQNTYIVLAVAKGTTLQQAKDTLRGKKLTYQLATPRTVPPIYEIINRPVLEKTIVHTDYTKIGNIVFYAYPKAYQTVYDLGNNFIDTTSDILLQLLQKAIESLKNVLIDNIKNLIPKF